MATGPGVTVPVETGRAVLKSYVVLVFGFGSGMNQDMVNPVPVTGTPVDSGRTAVDS